MDLQEGPAAVFPDEDPLLVVAAGDLAAAVAVVAPEEDGTAVEEEVLEDEETADGAAAEGAGTAATAEAYCKIHVYASIISIALVDDKLTCYIRWNYIIYNIMYI